MAVGRLADEAELGHRSSSGLHFGYGVSAGISQPGLEAVGSCVDIPGSRVGGSGCLLQNYSEPDLLKDFNYPEKITEELATPTIPPGGGSHFRFEPIFT